MNPSAQFFTKVKSQIDQPTPFWNFVKALPKGGNLHIHDSAFCDRGVLLQKYHMDPNLYFWATPTNVSRPQDPLYGSFGFFTYPPNGWSSASLQPIELLMDLVTVRNLSGSFLMDTFPVFQEIFIRTNDFVGYEPVYRTFAIAIHAIHAIHPFSRFIVAVHCTLTGSLVMTMIIGDMITNVLQNAMADNILYLEPRVSFGQTYTLINSTIDGGRKRPDNGVDHDVAIWHDIQAGKYSFISFINEYLTYLPIYLFDSICESQFQ
jgi:hypothetical protein